MNRINRRRVFGGLVVAPFAGALLARGETRVASADKPPPSAKRTFATPLSGRETLRDRYFPNVVLTTSEGEKVRFYDDLLKDKIVVLNMMYARCEGFCPTTTENLKIVRKLLRQQVEHDIFIYSLTVKPEQDSPPALKAYARAHGIVEDPHWRFLTGKPDEMDLLRHKLGFADSNPEIDRDKTRHSGLLRYGNEPLAIWGMCQGSARPDWIAREIGFAVPRQFKRHPGVNE